MVRTRKALKPENYSKPAHYRCLAKAVRLYFEEIKADRETLDWLELHFKYRAGFSEGTARRVA